MELINVEFYNTPDGEVVVKPTNKPARILKESDRELVTTMYQLISDRYPQAFEKLSEIYSAMLPNHVYYEYRVVHRFIRCNFGEYDQNSTDINQAGRFCFEEVKCPLRGECVYEGVICKAKLETHLTPREQEVAALIVEGYTTDEIAAKLYISPFTVNRHRDNIKCRLKIRNAAELVNYWKTNNL